MMSVKTFSDEYFMNEAIKEAKIAFEKNEVPVGAVIVFDNKIIAKAHNQSELLNDVTAHAEMLAITSASNYMNNKFLYECTIYVTLEPCIMCAGAIELARINKIVFAANDPKYGFISKHNNKLIKNKLKINNGINKKESLALLKSFFSYKRD